MPAVIKIKLSVMMFLQFFIWGAWYVTLGTYLAGTLHANGIQIGKAYSAMAIATIISPFFIGLIADRFFSGQKLMGFLHLTGGAILFYLPSVNNPDTFYYFILLYALIYSPTLALANNISFIQMKNPGKEFSAIRIWGTIGWIVTGVLIDRVFKLGPSALAPTFSIAAIASLALGLFSFALPPAPPMPKTTEVNVSQIIGKSAFALLKNSSFRTFFIASILICIPLSFYYSQTNQFLTETGLQNVTSKMTLGQISEAVFILLIPFFFRKAGLKNMILIGILAWAIRFALFGISSMGFNEGLLITGIVLHGVCYDFFFVTGQIYTDTVADQKNKNAAQGLITMATYGLGMWVGSLLSGYVAYRYTLSADSHDWQSIWMVPAIISVAVLVYFLLFFKQPKTFDVQAATALQPRHKIIKR